MTTNTEGHYIDVRGILVEVFRKDIKNLHVGVYPPNGRVRVAAPLRLGDNAVRMAIVARLGWIRRQQAEFEQQERQSQREFVTGESHYFEGRRYRLDVIECNGRPSVRLLNNTTMALRVRLGSDRDAREVVLEKWYRDKLRAHLPGLLSKWEPIIGEQVAQVGIKKMKTRWGSCNREARRIWLNLELIKKPVLCLEYVFVHEMVHLIERRHNDRFRELMGKFMPQWQSYRDVLTRAPLAHAEWQY